MPARVLTVPSASDSPAQPVVDGVGNHDVVAGLRGDVLRKQDQALRLVEAGVLGAAVGVALVPRAVGGQHRLEIGGELHQAVVAGVGDKPGTGVGVRLCRGAFGGGAASGREVQGLAREAQRARGRFRRHVGAVAAVQGALGLMLGDQFGNEHGEAVRVTFTGKVRHDVALGVDDHQSGPGARRVGLPGVQLRVVQDRVADLVALHGRGQSHRVSLVLELGRVHADRHQDIGVLLLEGAELVQDVQAVDAAERPEVQQHDLAAEGFKVQGLAAGVQPVTAHQFGGPDPEVGAYGFAHQRPSSFELRSASLASRSASLANISL